MGLRGGVSLNKESVEMYEGESVILRKARTSDEPLLKKWDTDDELNVLMGTDTLANLQSYLDQQNSRNSLRMMIQTKSGKVIGNIDLIHISWKSHEAELVVRIGESEFWGRGYGTDAVSTLLRTAFGEMNLESVYLRVYRSNVRAIKCYEKCGFIKEGILRRRFGIDHIVDIILMRAVSKKPAASASAGK